MITFLFASLTTLAFAATKYDVNQ